MVVEMAGGALVETAGCVEIGVAEVAGMEDDVLVGTLSGALQAAHDSY